MSGNFRMGPYPPEWGVGDTQEPECQRGFGEVPGGVPLSPVIIKVSRLKMFLSSPKVAQSLEAKYNHLTS